MHVQDESAVGTLLCIKMQKKQFGTFVREVSKDGRLKDEVQRKERESRRLPLALGRLPGQGQIAGHLSGRTAPSACPDSSSPLAQSTLRRKLH